MGLASDKILNAVIDSLSVEELKAIIAQKERSIAPVPTPMTQKELLKENYRKLIISMGVLHPRK